MTKTQFRIPKKLYKRAYLIFSSLVAVAVVLFLLLTIIPNKKEVAGTAGFSFVPTSSAQGTSQSYKLVLDASNNNVSFVKVNLKFDQQNVQLDSDPVVNTNSPLSNIVSVTPLEEANNIGVIEIVVTADSAYKGMTNGQIELATLSFTNTRDAAFLTVIDEETQVVDSNSNEIPFTITKAQIKSI